MSALDKLLGALDEEPALMIAVDTKTILNARNELAQLRAALDAAREVITDLSNYSTNGNPEDYSRAAAWLEKYPARPLDNSEM